MKTIILLRHARSSWKHPNLKDFDRPLAKRGRIEAPRMGQFLKRVNVIPGSVISSPAQRARQTTELFLKAMEMDPSGVSWNDILYYGGARDYLTSIQRLADEVDSVLLVGHNPLMEEIVALLCDEEGNYAVKLPSAGLVCIESPASEWKQVLPGSSSLAWLMTPDLLDRKTK